VSAPPTATVPTLDDLRTAAARIAPDIRRTPLVPADGDVLLKLESLQPTGSFKVRGAANHLRQVVGTVRGVITASSGNHGQAVAYVAGRLGIPAVVVVPETVTPIKAERIRGYGAELVRCGTTMPERTELARRLAAERGLHFVPSFDDPWIIAGQGTCGLEIDEQADEIATVVVPTGGGGLVSGVGLALKALRPELWIVGAEPARLARFAASRAAGARTRVPFAETIADGLRGQEPGILTFDATSRTVDEFVGIDDELIGEAVRKLFLDSRLVVEPSGAIAVAALMSGRVSRRPAVAVVSGGNLDPRLLASLLGACPTQESRGT
jgi:threonine dehydratase